ncbi:MAG: hypothetical protein PHV60_03240 [bacterium]|nr:hypothetical protein [bacterium]
MKTCLIKISSLILLALSCSSNIWAAALTVNYSDIVLENLQPGVPVSLLQRTGGALGVNNIDSLGANVFFDILVPSKNQLMEGYEPIPDIKWIKLERFNSWIKANQTDNFDLVVYVPYDQKLFGKKYQATLMVYALEGIGMLKSNIKTKILLSFTTERYKYEALDQKISEDQTNNKIIMIYPKITSVDEVNLKKKLDFSRLVVTNNSTEKMALTLYAIALGNIPAEVGLISFRNPNLELNNKESRSIDLSIDFPLLKLRKSQPMMIFIGVKDTKNPHELGQFGLLKLQFD